MPIQMPDAPPYAPLPTPPWIDEQSPPPPPPVPPALGVPAPSPRPRPCRARAAAIVVAMTLLCGGIGLEVGGLLFSPSPTHSTSATTTDKIATLPTAGSTPPASSGTSTDAI